MSRSTLLPPSDGGADETWDGATEVAIRPPRGGFGTTVLPAVERGSGSVALRRREEPRFVRLGRLGAGGLGEVEAVEDRDIGRKVAIKRVRADRASRGAMVRFLQEIRTIGHLEHANIVPIHDVGRDASGDLYYVMRHVDGETLESVISRLRKGDPEAHRVYGFERRVTVIGAVLEALDYAHANGVVHRDVKPTNVMIGRYGEVMLVDWGIARVGSAPDLPEGEGGPSAVAETRVGAVIGTPAYMSPEQAQGLPVDARSDLYSVSVMLHELLTLRHYLDDCSGADEMIEAVPTRPVPFASDVRSPHQPKVPHDLAWFVARGVEKDPDARYASAREMLDRLSRRREGDIPMQCPVTATRRASAVVLGVFDRHPMLFLSGAVMGLAAAVLTLVGGTAVTVAALGLVLFGVP